MAKAKKTESEHEGGPEPAKPKGGGVGIAGWIMLALLVPAGVMTMNCARSWSQVVAEERALAADHAKHMELIGRLKPFADVLQGKDKYQICNRTADTVTVTWLAAAYSEADQIKMFESSRCRDWKPVVLAQGENRFVTVSSAQEGCNWNGNVMYFAIAYTRESAEQTTYFEDVEMFRGFDRQCHNIQ
jgi:hypothetical protein